MIIDNKNFKGITPISEKKVTGWYSLVAIKNNSQIIGITKDNILSIDTLNKYEVIDADEKLIFIMAIFEESSIEIRKKINKSYKLLGINGDSVFPYEKLINYALTLSDYWAELALDWFDELIMYMNLRLYVDVVNLRNRNQSIKHRVQRITKNK